VASPWAVWIGELQGQFVDVDDGLSTVFNWNTKRGADYQCLAQMVFCCEDVWSRPTPSGKRLSTWLSRGDEPQRSFKDAVVGALRELWHIATAANLNQAFINIPRRVAPVEFVFMG
jgi:hypothetical protein